MKNLKKVLVDYLTLKVFNSETIDLIVEEYCLEFEIKRQDLKLVNFFSRKENENLIYLKEKYEEGKKFFELCFYGDRSDRFFKNCLKNL